LRKFATDQINVYVTKGSEEVYSTRARIHLEPPAYRTPPPRSPAHGTKPAPLDKAGTTAAPTRLG